MVWNRLRGAVHLRRYRPSPLGLEETPNSSPAKVDDASTKAVLCTTADRLSTTPLPSHLDKFLGIETFGAPLEYATRHSGDLGLQLPVRDILYQPGLGAFAFRCPEFDAWHLAGEAYFLNTLDEAVILTPLHAFTARPTPIRVHRLSGIAPGCSCGRALPRLTLHSALPIHSGSGLSTLGAKFAIDFRLAFDTNRL
jgi:hypothetical protein